MGKREETEALRRELYYTLQDSLWYHVFSCVGKSRQIDSSKPLEQSDIHIIVTSIVHTKKLFTLAVDGMNYQWLF